MAFPILQLFLRRESWDEEPVFTADADTQAIVKTILDRPDALGIRPITFEVDRHPLRDPGMVKDGPELVRRLRDKTKIEKVILLWDHSGSGWESRRTTAESQQVLRVRLDQVTWKDRSDAIAVNPEIEEWIWHDPPAIARLLGMSLAALQESMEKHAKKHRSDFASMRSSKPKELFEHAIKDGLRRKPRMEDFERIAKVAKLEAWRTSPSFAQLSNILRRWFTPP